MISVHKERFVNAIQWQDLTSNLHFKFLLVLKGVLMIYSCGNKQVVIPLSLQRRVEGLVQEHLDRALLSLDKNGGNTESGSEVDKKANSVNMDEQHDSLLDRSVMEKILQRKSIRMRNFQRSWQVCMFHMHHNSVFVLGNDRGNLPKPSAAFIALCLLFCNNFIVCS